MAYQFLLPDIGEGVVEAEILKWFVKPGDAVVEDQPLAEVMTDKATVTIPSPKRGTVTRLLWKEGDVARVHHALVEMELADGGPDVASVVPLPKAHIERPLSSLLARNWKPPWRMETYWISPELSASSEPPKR